MRKNFKKNFAKKNKNAPPLFNFVTFPPPEMLQKFNIISR